MIKHKTIGDSDLRTKIKIGQILFGGNHSLRIYGRLDCRSGKRMKRENRVFFATEEEAFQNNFRPCAHCMWAAYKKWKNDIV